MSITSKLFRAARLSGDARALSSGSPKRVVRRAKNRAVGRTLRKAGAWRRLGG